MDTFLAVSFGCLLGSFLGNLGLLLVIGAMAGRAERKQREKVESIQELYREIMEKEAARMKNYVKMEG